MLFATSQKHHLFSSQLASFSSPSRRVSTTSPLRFAATENESSTQQHRTVEGECSAEQVIKKSRFIGISTHCESWEDAQTFLASVREQHPKSRHVCFGFVAGHNPVQERSSDDGEPTGTAGSPILGGIKGEGLSDTVCAVVRYSGGIKLGAGGLIRAYGGTARLVLRETQTRILIPKSTFRIRTTGASVGSVYEIVNKFGGSVGEEAYQDTGEMEATVVCKTEQYDDIALALSDATRGGIIFINS